VFLDLEYFGWDDPAKLVGDFLLHPGMKLTESMKSFWLNGASDIFGPSVISRMRAILPLLGICWCLILLNDFRKEHWLRRARVTECYGDIDKDRLDSQLSKAKKMLECAKSN